ncbi:hypothetical protein BTVI_146814 [Pitangus sulphuratus]|nr:hypothetical protein BTVI_146814 [Pitangus sulphuratus]
MDVAAGAAETDGAAGMDGAVGIDGAAEMDGEDHLLQAQEQYILTRRNSGKKCQEASIDGKEAAEPTQSKKKLSGSGNKNRWEEYREIGQDARDKVREAKVELELSLAKDIKDNGKGFYRYVAKKRNTRYKVGLLQKEMGNLANLDKEKAEVLNDFYASAFDGKCSTHAIQVRKGKCRNWENEDSKPTVGEDLV